MKPSELYAMQPQYDTKSVIMLRGFYYDHVPELGDDTHHIDENDNKLTIIRVIKEFDFDGRRFWRLATVWHDGIPVMVIQNAGREGDDHHARFITNREQYQKMISYLLSIKQGEPLDENKLFDPEQDIKGLDYFYGNSLNGNFERHIY